MPDLEEADARDGSASAPPEAIRLVGIGASAGGITALREFFRNVPEHTGISFVVIMHLSPEHESHLAEVLQQNARIPVRQVRERTMLGPDQVYVIPPDRSLVITDGHLELTDFEEPRGRRSPIDIFFRTLAEVHPDGIGVLLSGSGTDGVVGLKAIKEMGGIILAQTPADAEYDSMPRAAIATGLVDFVLPAGSLAQKAIALWSSPRPHAPMTPHALEKGEAETVRAILAHLRARTGRDFQGYKKSTVLRRITRRMQVHGTGELEAYLEVIRRVSGEPGALLKDLLISVTNFFRDPAAYGICSMMSEKVFWTFLVRAASSGVTSTSSGISVIRATR
jgi:two-component system CheB/CheR fusion protein